MALRMVHATYVRVNALNVRAPHADLGALAKKYFLCLDAPLSLSQDHLVKLVPIVEIV